MDTATEQNFDYLCRTCMNTLIEVSSYDANSQQQWQYITDTIEECGASRIDVLLSNAVMQIEVQPNDELPQKICRECLQYLLSAYRFQQMCVKSEQHMRAVVVKRNADPIQIKLENEDQVKGFEMDVASLSRIADSLRRTDKAIEHYRETHSNIGVCVKNEPLDDDAPYFEYSHEATVSVESKVLIVKTEEEEQVSAKHLKQHNKLNEKGRNEEMDKQTLTNACDICALTFRTPAALKLHKILRHRAKKQNEKTPTKRQHYAEKPREISEQSSSVFCNKKARYEEFACDRSGNTSPEPEQSNSVDMRSAKKAAIGNEINASENLELELSETTQSSIEHNTNSQSDVTEFLISKPYRVEELNIETTNKTKHSVDTVVCEVLMLEKEEEQVGLDTSRHYCHLCSKSYQYKANFTKHLKQHNNLDARKKITLKPNPKDIHKAETHKQMQRYACNLCEQTYFNSFGLTMHKILKHPVEKQNNKVNQLPCNTSGHSRQFITHKKRLHAAERPQKKSEQISKNICDKKVREKIVCEPAKSLPESLYPKSLPESLYPKDIDMKTMKEARIEDKRNASECLTQETEAKQSSIAQSLQIIKQKTSQSDVSEFRKTKPSADEELEAQKEMPVKPNHNEVQNADTDKRMLGYGCDICKLIFRSPIVLRLHKMINHRTKEQNNKTHTEIRHSTEKPQEKSEQSSERFASESANTLSESPQSIKTTKETDKDQEVELNSSEATQSSTSVSSQIITKEIEHKTNSQSDASELRISSDMPSSFHKQKTMNDTTQPQKTIQKVIKLPVDLRDSMTKHKAVQHSTVKKLQSLKQHSCKFCNKIFSSLSSLRVHMQSVHQLNQAYKCSYCDKSFNKQRDLTIHLYTHYNKKPYECPYCPLKFRINNDLINHREKMHKTIKPHVCDICNTSFTQLSVLKIHKAVHHSSVKP